MRRRILLTALVLLLGAASAVGAEATRQLKSYASLLAALTAGEPVRVVIDYGRCGLSIDGEAASAPEAIGILAIDAAEVFAVGSVGNEQEYLAFSHTTLIHRRDVVYNYVKFRVYADGSVTVRAMYLNPVDFSPAMDEEFTTCIADGKGAGAAAFFAPRR